MLPTFVANLGQIGTKELQSYKKDFFALFCLFRNKLDKVGNTSIVLKMEKTNILGDRLPYNGPSFYVAHLLRLTIWSDGGCADVLATSSDGRTYVEVVLLDRL